MLSVSFHESSCWHMVRYETRQLNKFSYCFFFLLRKGNGKITASWRLAQTNPHTSPVGNSFCSPYSQICANQEQHEEIQPGRHLQCHSSVLEKAFQSLAWLQCLPGTSHEWLQRHWLPQQWNRRKADLGEPQWEKWGAHCHGHKNQKGKSQQTSAPGWGQFNRGSKDCTQSKAK